MKKIPEIIIERISCGELKAEDFYEEYGKEEVDSAVKAVETSDREILNAYSSEKIKSAVMEKVENGMATGSEDLKSRKNPVWNVRFISMAAAAVLVATVALPNLVKSQKMAGALVKPAEIQSSIKMDGVRAKGFSRTQIKVYKKDGAEILKLKNGDHVKEGDILQITYTAGKDKYGMIFSIDGNDNITQHYPESTWIAEELTQNGETPLNFAYELDDAPKYEVFYFVSSKNPFELEKKDGVLQIPGYLDCYEFIVVKD